MEAKIESKSHLQTDIVTLRMDLTSQLFFEALRQKHFPPERNYIAAHLTLFHTLPPIAEVSDALRRITEHQHAFSMRATGLRSLGCGVAFTLGSIELLSLHMELSHLFRAYLSAQDRQKFMPHVVIQNKTTQESSKVLLSAMQSEFRQFEVVAEGLELWHYRGGPWDLVETFLFERREARC